MEIAETREGKVAECAALFALRLLTDHPKREAIRRRDVLNEPVRETARSCDVSRDTISR
jgi:hypothetical protein